VAVMLALLALRRDGRARDALALAAGLALACAVGMKLLAVLTAVPVAFVLLGAQRGRSRLILFTVAGGLAGTLALLLPVLGSPTLAFDDLVVSHLRAGQALAAGPLTNLKLLFLHREEPLEALAGIGALIALLRRDRAVIPLLAWVAVSLGAVLVYKPLFPHHLVMLIAPLALLAAVGIAPTLTLPGRVGEKIGTAIVMAGLLLATLAAGAYIDVGDIRLALVKDLHNAEMTAAVAAVSRPGEFWISDNPYAVAAADRDLPGPLVDTSGQRTAAGLLTVADLEAGRVRYHVRWVLVDSFRLDAVPGFRDWLDAHFHAFEALGGRAMVYEGNSPG
jgi:hypothetical protein